MAVLPAALLVAAIAWQLVLAGHATWLAGNAARVGARAQAVGRDPDAAVRSSLPSYLRRGLEVRPAADSGRVEVELQVPLVLPRWPSPLTVQAAAAMEREDG